MLRLPEVAAPHSTAQREARAALHSSPYLIILILIIIIIPPKPLFTISLYRKASLSTTNVSSHYPPRLLPSPPGFIKELLSS
ncbi:hypothetical protein BJX70DRAFT_384192 [Aspergillus crustosus]